MALKTVPPRVKQSALERLRASARGENTATIADEARRASLSPQAIRGWVRDDKKANPELWIPRPRPAATPAPAETSDTLRGGGLQAALEAIGAKPDASGAAPGAPGPVASPSPPSAAASAASAAEDEALVFMAGNTVMGWTTRGVFGYLCFKGKVSLPFRPFENLCVLTDQEKAGLRPCIPALAPIIRKWVGSNENVALGVAASVLAGGVLSRAGDLLAAVRAAVVEVRSREAARPKPEAAA